MNSEEILKVQKALPGAGWRSFHSVEIKISIIFMRCSVFSELQKKKKERERGLLETLFPKQQTHFHFCTFG